MDKPTIKDITRVKLKMANFQEFLLSVQRYPGESAAEVKNPDTIISMTKNTNVKAGDSSVVSLLDLTINSRNGLDGLSIAYAGRTKWQM